MKWITIIIKIVKVEQHCEMQWIFLLRSHKSIFFSNFKNYGKKVKVWDYMKWFSFCNENRSNCEKTESLDKWY
jgi:hypothetical protein